MTTELLERVEGDYGSSGLPEQSQRRRAEEVVAAIYADAERVKRREVDEAIDRLEACDDLTDGQRDVVEAMADALVDRLLAVPIRRLRGTPDPVVVDTALRLFDPDVEEERGPVSGPVGRDGGDR